MKILPHDKPGIQPGIIEPDWDNMSFREIEKAVGINHQTIQARCQKYGLTKSEAVACGRPRRGAERLL